jgi:prepilin-type N-terminal cleavage/methylation domain-containing protein
VRRGLSLLEVVVAVSLIALVIPLLLGLFPSALKSLRRAEFLQAAATLATYRMDEANLLERAPGQDLNVVVDLAPHRYRIVREFYALDAYRLDCVVQVSEEGSGLAPVRLESRFPR